MCYEAGIPVTSLPGAAARITALTLSGLSTRRFAFEAFLPTDKKEKAAVLEELKHETRTMILYEAPHRLVRTLEELMTALGEERKVTICRELTKKHETAFQTILREALDYYRHNDPKGECVIVLEGKSRAQIRQEEGKCLGAAFNRGTYGALRGSGSFTQRCHETGSKDRGVSKREIYQYLL